MTNLSHSFLKVFQGRASHQNIANLYANIDAVTHNNITMPCLRIDGIQPINCYVASPYAMMIGYAKDELIKLPTYQRWILRPILGLLSILLKLARIDTIVGINNYALSTNPTPKFFDDMNWLDFTIGLTKKYPNHVLMIRSLNQAQHAPLLQKLKQANWQLLTSRQVYLFPDMPTALNKTNSKRDSKLHDDGLYYFKKLHHQTPITEFEQAVYFYNELYLKKYSYQNVQFTPIMLQEMVGQGILDLYLLVQTSNQQVVGVVGLVGENGIITAPIVGYDMQLSPKLGLYRRIINFIMHYANERHLYLNLSSGASDFKMVRGAVSELEYSAVFVNHLPKYQWYRRLIWRLLTYVTNHIYAKILQKYQL